MTTTPVTTPRISPLAALAGGLALLYFVLALIYGLIVPIFEGPDEREHYGFVRFLAENGRIPDVNFERGPFEQQATQGPLFYLSVAVLVWPLELGGIDEILLVNPQAVAFDFDDIGNKNGFVHTPAEAWPFAHGAVRAIQIGRVVSALYGALAVLATVWVASRVNMRVAALAGLMVALLPQFLFAGGLVSNDTTSAATAMLSLWLLLRYSEQPSLARALVAGFVIGLAVLSKAGGAALLPLAAGLVLWQRWGQWRAMFSEGPLILAACLTVSGWWLWLNFSRYGDPTGVAGHVLVMPGARIDYSQAANLLAFIRETSYSFWGVFGISNIAGPAPIYWVLIGLGGVSLLAGLLALRVWPQARLVGILSVGWLAVVLPPAFIWILQNRAWHGRLLFPGLGALAILGALGIVWLNRRWGWARGLYALPVGIAAFGVLAPLLLLGPTYAPSPIVSALPSQAMPVCRVHPPLVLMGVNAPHEVRAGERLTVQLYWQLERAITYDDMVIVNWLDATLQPVVQQVSYHGQGNWPTSLWQAETIYADKVTVRIPVGIQTPSLLTLAISTDHYGTAVAPVCDGEPRDPLEPLAEVRVIPALWTSNGLQNRAALVDFDGTVALIAAEWPPSVAAGETFAVTLTWRVGQPPGRPLTRFVHLEGDNGMAAQADGLAGNFPVRAWQTGDVLHEEVWLSVPSDAAAGEYRLRVGFYDEAILRLPTAADVEDRPILGTLTIRP